MFSHIEEPELFNENCILTMQASHLQDITVCLLCHVTVHSYNNMHLSMVYSCENARNIYHWHKCYANWPGF
jgi:hypothetical protein